MGGEDVEAALLHGVGGSGHGQGVGVIGGAEAGMFVLADVVIDKQVHHLGRCGQRSEETGGGGEVRLVGVDALDEGYAHPVGGAERGDKTQAVEDALVRHAGVAAMEGRVHVLKVHEEQLAALGDAADDVGAGIERGIDGTVETATAKFVEELHGIVGMHEGLAATEGDAATALRHHLALLLHLGHQLVHRPRPSAHRQRRRGTGIGARPAKKTGLRRWTNAVRRQLQGTLRTDADARPAADTLFLCIETLRLRTLSFRVMAPHTPQRTSLQEQRRPYPRPIVERKPLDVENEWHFFVGLVLTASEV